MTDARPPHAPSADDMQFEVRDCATPGRRIGIARLNRPAQLNALNLSMCQSMLDTFRAWASDESIACVVLAGNGPKGFCAGGDVAEVIRRVRAGGPDRFVYGDAFFDVEYRLDLLLHAFPKPVVTWAHGVDMGGGVGLSVAGSERIVTEGLKLAMPEIHIGLFPDVGGGWFLNRVPGEAGLLLAMTGAIVDEADALFAGLADHAIAHERQPEFLERLAALDWSGASGARRARLRAFCLAFAAERPLALPESGLLRHRDAIRAIGRCGDAASFLAALREAAAREPWFRRPYENLAAGSPTAARVTFEYMRRCRPLGIADTLALDLVVARQCQRHEDFPEGVRALLIDKTRDAAWTPATLDAVTDARVAGFFEPLAH
ncbi:MAG TPA: enoyl-CoA hydratase/isomerase family protein [Burkholderiaceae bacterium]|nr:enoyl-CoA hydratase/isomerase family protein [Burkholderiaceae bacterium]